MIPVIGNKMTAEDKELVCELYKWMQEKQLTTKQALQLLNRTEQVVIDTRSVEADNLKI